MIRLLTCIAGALASWSAPPLLAQPDAVSEVDQLPSASSGFGLQPLQLGGQLFRLGGYLETVAADTLEEPARLGLDRISLIGSWQSGGAWSGLLEVEMKQLVRLQPGNSSVEEGRPVLERAYLDYAHADALQIRVGKLLTPIGRWNPLHAAPLTWTTSRPLITEDTFPTNATGAMLRGVVPVWGQALEWSLWASPGEELFPEARAQTFNEAYGLRLAQDFGPYWQLGLSVADYEEDGDPTRKTLYSADFRFAAGGWELSGEFAHRVLSRTTQRADEEGLYLQAVAPLSSRWFMVLRHESFDSAGASDDLHLTLGGITLRWSRSLVGKLEYRRATENAAGVPEGWLGSLAVMFQMRRLAGLLLTGVLLTAQAEDPATVAPAPPAVTLAVVVAVDDLRAQIDRSVLSLVYRRKRQFWPDGRRIHPINLPAAHPLRVQFSQQVLGANPAALVDYWNAEYFLGVLPPFVAASPEALATRVAQTPGAVGYVSACAVDARLRVLFYLSPDGAGETGAPNCPDRNL